MKVIAHRGASGYAPENTLEAFKIALELGARNFEFDVHRTKDGVLVVHHDYGLPDENGTEVKISELNYAELSKLNVAFYFRAPGFYRIPKLNEVLDLIGGSSEMLNFEIKNDGNVYPGIETDLIRTVEKSGLAAKALLSSFDYGTLQRCRLISKDIKLGLLSRGLSEILLFPAIRRAKAINCFSFHTSLKTACRAYISKIKEEGFAVNIYTVNTRAEALKLQGYGTDGIFSNYPDILGGINLEG